MKNSVLLVIACAFSAINCGIFDYTELEDPYTYFFGGGRTTQLGSGNNGECTTTSVTGAPVSGVCQLRGECLRNGGTPRTFCGLWTVCCVYPKTCGKITNSKVSYFVSGTDPIVEQPCRFTAKVTNNNICQMRIDFTTLTLAPPTWNVFQMANLCESDVLTINSPLIKVPNICGENSGQHVYIPVNVSQSVDSVSINVDLAARVTGGSTTLPTPVWSIKVTQLECPGTARIRHQQSNANVQAADFQQLAPQGCLQYFTAPRGIVKSFGFIGISLGGPNLYVVNQNYAICFKRSLNTCGVRFTTLAFVLGSENGIVCSDYLFIPEAQGNGISPPLPLPVAKFCGNIISPTIITSTTPGPLYISFRADETSTTEERGFAINYEITSTGCY